MQNVELSSFTLIFKQMIHRFALLDAEVWGLNGGAGWVQLQSPKNGSRLIGFRTVGPQTIGRNCPICDPRVVPE